MPPRNRKQEMTQRWRENNREHYLELSRGYSRKRRQRKEVMEYQKAYLTQWVKDNKDKKRSYSDKYRQNNLKKIYEKGKRWSDRMWEEYRNHYGHSCLCCGETEVKFLTLEHLYGDGKIHRKQVKCGSRAMQIVDIKRRGWPKDCGYAVLCYNCNCAKDKNKGICPHQEKLNGILKLCA